jgi:hypothetical protein
MNFKFLVPDQVIFKRHSIFTNVEISFWVDAFSLEEGWGMQDNDDWNGHKFGVCRSVSRVCKPSLINHQINKFNKP